MVTRELLSSQSILGSFNTKTTGGTSTQTSNQSFVSLLKTKQSTSASQTTSSKTVSDDSVNKTTLNTKSQDSNVSSTTQSDTQETSASNQNSESSQVSKVETQSSKTEEKQTDDTALTDEAAAKLEALKAKLKEKTGMSDEEIEMMMQMMSPALQEIIEQLPMTTVENLDVSGIADALTTLQHLDVNQMLQQPVDQSLVNQFSEQLQQFVDVLETTVSQMPEGDEADQMTDLLKALNVQVEEVSDAVATLSDEKSLKDIVGEMMQTQKPIKTDATEEVKMGDGDVSQLSDDTEEQAVVLENAFSNDEESANDSNSTAKQTKAVEGVSEATTEDSDVEVNVQNQNQNFEAKLMETILRSTETKQMPRQEIFSQVMDAIKANLSVTDNGTQMLIKLQPEQLGDVEVKVSAHKGIILAEIKVENETVKAAIETNLDQLRNALTQKGLTASQISVSVDSGKKEQEESAFYQQSKNQKNQAKVELEDDTSFIDRIQSGYEDGGYDSSTIDYFG